MIARRQRVLIETGGTTHDVQAHQSDVVDLALNETDRRLFSFSRDGFLIVCDLETLGILLRISHWNAFNQNRSVYDTTKPVFVTEETTTLDENHYAIAHGLRHLYGKHAITRLTHLFARHELTHAPGLVALDALPAMIMELMDGMVGVESQERIEKYARQVKAAAGERVSFAEFLALVYETWHGRGVNALEITCSCLVPELKLLITGASDTSICLINYVSGNLMSACMGHDHPITAVCPLVPNQSTMMVAADAGGCLKLWRTDVEYRQQRSLWEWYNLHEDDATLVIVTVLRWTSTQLISGDDAGWVRVWDLAPLLSELPDHPDQPQEVDANMLLNEWTAHGDSVIDIQISTRLCGDATVILSCAKDGLMKVWLPDGTMIGLLNSAAQQTSVVANGVLWDLEVDVVRGPSLFYIHVNTSLFCYRPMCWRMKLKRPNTPCNNCHRHSPKDLRYVVCWCFEHGVIGIVVAFEATTVSVSQTQSGRVGA